MTSRTEAPTERRLREARRSGYVPFSRTLARSAALVAALVTLPLVLGRLVVSTTTFWRDALRPGARLPDNLAERSAELVLDVLGPLLYASFVAVWLVGLAQTGGALRGRGANPTGTSSRPGPSVARRLLPLLGALAAFCAATALVAEHLESAANVVSQPELALDFFGVFGVRFLEVAAGVSVVLGLTDWLLARRDWYESLRMTASEKRDELRREYGAPELRAAQHRARQSARGASSGRAPG